MSNMINLCLEFKPNSLDIDIGYDTFICISANGIKDISSLGELKALINLMSLTIDLGFIILIMKVLMELQIFLL